MKKYIFFMPAVALFLLCSACSTVNSTGKIVKLNSSEYSKLVTASRNTLLSMPSSKVSETDKKFIKKNPPNFRVKYTGFKKGKYSASWELPSGKTLQVFGEGNMLDFRSSFEKITLVSIKVNRPGRPGRP